jgi:hypothetical protein
MAARNKLEYWAKIYNEWIKYGKVIYDEGDITVIEANNEFLIRYKGTIVHLMKDRIWVKVLKRRYISTAPRFRGVAKKVTLRVLNTLPNNVSTYIMSHHPLAALVARG